MKNSFNISVSLLVFATACTQQPAQIVLKGQESFGRDIRSGYADRPSHTVSNSSSVVASYGSSYISENTEQKAAISSIDVSDLSPPLEDKSEEKKIIEFILNDLLLANEAFVSHIEENFSNWDDDGEMLVQLLTGYLAKPGTYNFKQMMSADKAQFAKNLLQTVLEKGEHLQSLIIPKLKNWDPDRIALLDMIMMKMGVAEFLYFETIQPKVTINEYIDLAKDYSTSQSGHFVNGILDNIHKELVQEGKMQKVEYKKS